jgi:hypothetical protein
MFFFYLKEVSATTYASRIDATSTSRDRGRDGGRDSVRDSCGDSGRSSGGDSGRSSRMEDSSCEEGGSNTIFDETLFLLDCCLEYVEIVGRTEWLSLSVSWN